MSKPKMGHARLKELGFANSRERRAWLQEHRQEILDYAEKNSAAKAQRNFYISAATFYKLKLSEAEEPKRTTRRGEYSDESLQKVNPVELANALLEKFLNLQSENLVLKAKNNDLQGRVRYLESQREVQDEESNKEFQTKLRRVIAEPGE